MTINLINMTSI